jgi:hypothetical protein
MLVTLFQQNLQGQPSPPPPAGGFSYGGAVAWNGHRSDAGDPYRYRKTAADRARDAMFKRVAAKAGKTAADVQASVQCSRCPTLDVRTKDTKFGQLCSKCQRLYGV